MTPEICRGFKVFPANEFYPINYDEWEQIFDVDFTETVMEAIKNSSVVHLWNNLSHGKVITKSNMKTAYEVIAEKNCPTTFEASGEYF